MTDGHPPVDVEAFRAAMSAAGIEEIVDSTLETFVDQAETTFAEMRVARESLDAEGLRATAHALKSSALNIHATELAEALRELEGTAAQGDAQAAARAFDEVDSRLASVLAYLRALGQ